MNGIRSEKVGDLIKKEISLILNTKIKDERFKLININAVKVSKDLSIATVYYSIIGSSTDDLDQLPEKAFAKLAGMLRSELSKEIKIRRVPKLIFRYDESIEYASKIEKLLESNNVNNVYITPKTAIDLKNVINLDYPNISNEQLLYTCKHCKINTIVIGPEKYLVNGNVDFLEQHGYNVFGPNKKCSQIEGSKVYSKELLNNLNITNLQNTLLRNGVSLDFNELNNLFMCASKS